MHISLTSLILLPRDVWRARGKKHSREQRRQTSHVPCLFAVGFTPTTACVFRAHEIGMVINMLIKINHTASRFCGRFTAGTQRDGVLRSLRASEHTQHLGIRAAFFTCSSHETTGVRVGEKSGLSLETILTPSYSAP